MTPFVTLSDFLQSILPISQIIRCITEFLPVQTLLQCTLVTTTWEREARNQLHSRRFLHLWEKLLPAEPDRSMATYLSKPMHHYGGPKNVQITIHQKSNFTQFLSEFAQFAAKYSKTVKYLLIDYPITAEPSQSHDFFKICSTLINLTSFTVDPMSWTGNRGDPDVVQTALRKNLIPTNISFPRVRTLGFYLSSCPFAPHGDEIIKNKLVNDILPLFPNFDRLLVNDVIYQGANSKLFDRLLNHTELSSLSLTLENWGTRDTQLMKHVKHNNLLTSLELCEITERNAPLYEQLLHRFSPYLQKFHLYSICSNDPDQCTLHIPIFPKLKVFKISGGLRERFPPARFIFETKCEQFSLNYAKQFPSLEKLCVCNGYKKYITGDDVTDEGFLEGVVPFLWDVFLKENIPACQTLREFELPFPLRARFRLFSTDLDNTEWEWRDSNDYFDRIEETFPRVGYHVVSPAWRMERMAKVERLVRIAVNLGFSEERVAKGLMDGCLMDNNVEI